MCYSYYRHVGYECHCLQHANCILAPTQTYQTHPPKIKRNAKSCWWIDDLHGIPKLNSIPVFWHRANVTWQTKKHRQNSKGTGHHNWGWLHRTFRWFVVSVASVSSLSATKSFVSLEVRHKSYVSDLTRLRRRPQSWGPGPENPAPACGAARGIGTFSASQ